MAKLLVVAGLIIALAACSSTTTQQPLPTLAQLPSSSNPTPTTENQFNSGTAGAPTPEQTTGTQVNLRFDGALQGALTRAVLTFEVGGNYTLLFDQPDGTENPVQVRLILAGNIEPGSYAIVPDDDFQLPAGQMVAARFDLGFVPEDLSGTFVLDSLGENNHSGSLDLTARSAEGTITVTGRFESLNAAVIG